LVTTASLVEAVLMVMVALGLLKALGKEEEEEEDVVVVQREDVVVIVLVLVVVTVLVTVLAVLAPATAGSSRTSRFGQRWSEPAACTRLQSQASPGSIVSGRWSCLLSVRRRCLSLAAPCRYRPCALWWFWFCDGRRYGMFRHELQLE
jgi:hypothetical protein